MTSAIPTNLSDRRGGSGAYLGPNELVQLSCRFGEDVAKGKYPQMCFDTDQRWHERIYRDDRVDVWLITWMPAQGTQLHDHGGSSGAFTVISGHLDEAVYIPRGEHSGELAEFGRGTGGSIGFGPHYIHDVRNLGDEPAVSVHAYSHPLNVMNYYDLEDRELVRIGYLETDDPESEFVALAAS